ncbi:hypothetical protein HNS38_11275 [Lentimicrobium sp. L6]|uniref:hypothetical protein n=1 Tax=Lentimicrobium sp. L6 TaxID=2735916 RepID=UPI0015534426|nr:hypothetical protein [Lentimicrobium sp. L6]NPD85346.1 hypothetical protein [Lentimicrobium sp. L6]
MKKILAYLIISCLFVSCGNSKNNVCPKDNGSHNLKKTIVGMDENYNDIYAWYCTKCDKVVKK